uniref:Uncharacterized protein n=1 Tax=Glossina austeni TaxID=7395 RepID=A0A1A9UML1_GLOAU
MSLTISARHLFVNKYVPPLCADGGRGGGCVVSMLNIIGWPVPGAIPAEELPKLLGTIASSTTRWREILLWKIVLPSFITTEYWMSGLKSTKCQDEHRNGRRNDTTSSANLFCGAHAHVHDLYPCHDCCDHGHENYVVDLDVENDCVNVNGCGSVYDDLVVHVIANDYGYGVFYSDHVPVWGYENHYHPG